MRFTDEVTWHPRGVYRTFHQWAIIVACLTAVVFFDVAMTIVFVKAAQTSGVRDLATTIFGGVALLVIPVVLLARAARGAIVLKADRIEIRKVFSTIRVKWSDVDHFSFGDNRSKFFNSAATLHTTDGREIVSWAISGPTITSEKSVSFMNAETLVDELNTIVERARSGHLDSQYVAGGK